MFKNQNKTKTFIILREKVFKKFFVEKMYTVGLMKIFCLMTALYFSSDFKTIFRLKCKNFKKCKEIKKKQERKLTSHRRFEGNEPNYSMHQENQVLASGLFGMTGLLREYFRNLCVCLPNYCAHQQMLD